jgi:hypothetical protein
MPDAAQVNASKRAATSPGPYPLPAAYTCGPNALDVQGMQEMHLIHFWNIRSVCHTA